MTFAEARRTADELRERAVHGEPISNVQVRACGEDCPRCGARSWGHTPEGLAQCHALPVYRAQARDAGMVCARRLRDGRAERRGIARAATITATPAGIAGLVELWYRQGWRHLVIHQKGRVVGWIIPGDRDPRGVPASFLATPYWSLWSSPGDR